MYELYINGVRMPVTPAKIQVKYANKNKTVDLINESQINISKKSGLRDISFDLLLPNNKYPFAVYPNGYMPAKLYMDFLMGIKENAIPIQFILTRSGQNSSNYGNENITSVIEDLTFTDDAKEGTDVKCAIKLREWKPYGTKIYSVRKQTKTITEQMQRSPSSNAPKSGVTYKVVKGDTLWAIAKAHYGNGAQYTKIVEANQIKNPNLIYPGQELVIP